MISEVELVDKKPMNSKQGTDSELHHPVAVERKGRYSIIESNQDPDMLANPSERRADERAVQQSMDNANVGKRLPPIEIAEEYI